MASTDSNSGHLEMYLKTYPCVLDVDWRMSIMLYFKSCPKCKGDMVNTNDVYGDYKRCLQCGLTNEIKRTDVVKSVIRRISKNGGPSVRDTRRIPT